MFKKIIKIPKKASFSDLTVSEVILMIEADSALQPQGNEFFDGSALDEFLHCADLSRRPDLEEIRSCIASNIYIDVPGRKSKKINVGFLEQYIEELKSRGSHAL